jgi:hypothetical protein
MRDFKTEKTKLIQEIDAAIGKAQSVKNLEKIKGLVESLNSHSDLVGELSNLVMNELGARNPVGEKIIDFENYFRDKTNLIKSDSLRHIAKNLKKSGIEITFFGFAWTKQRANWIYFNTVLDVEALRRNFQLGTHILIHENLDPKSGLEKGFIDDQTGEGLMGRIQ